MSAVWTTPEDPAAAEPATADWMRVNVTQNLRWLKDEARPGAVVKVAYAPISQPSGAFWSTTKTLVDKTFSPEGSGNVLSVEATYHVRVEPESNFLDQKERNAKFWLDYSFDGGSSWNKAAENLQVVKLDEAAFTGWSFVAHIRAMFAAPSSGDVQVRLRHTAYSDAAHWIEDGGPGWLVIQELEATQL